MDIKELKEITKDLPDDMKVCGSGYYGEKLEVWNISVGSVRNSVYPFNAKTFDALVINMESPGEEPD